MAAMRQQRSQSGFFSGVGYGSSSASQAQTPSSASNTPSAVGTPHTTFHFNIPSSQPLSRTNHASHRRPRKEEWFSLEGYLYMKCLSGAMAFLQSKKRLYFGLEEFENRLVYYRDKIEFNRRRECIGSIALNNTMCSLLEGNLCAFVLHTAGKKYVMEAENEKCAHCWLNALQQRREDVNQNLEIIDLPALVLGSLRRRRSGSRSLPSSSGERSTSPPANRKSSEDHPNQYFGEQHSSQPNSSSPTYAKSFDFGGSGVGSSSHHHHHHHHGHNPMNGDVHHQQEQQQQQHHYNHHHVPRSYATRRRSVATSTVGSSLQPLDPHRQRRRRRSAHSVGLSVTTSATGCDSAATVAAKDQAISLFDDSKPPLSIDANNNGAARNNGFNKAPNVEQPPAWLENWINNWLTDQLTYSNSNSCTVGLNNNNNGESISSRQCCCKSVGGNKPHQAVIEEEEGVVDDDEDEDEDEEEEEEEEEEVVVVVVEGEMGELDVEEKLTRLTPCSCSPGSANSSNSGGAHCCANGSISEEVITVNSDASTQSHALTVRGTVSDSTPSCGEVLRNTRLTRNTSVDFDHLALDHYPSQHHYGSLPSQKRALKRSKTSTARLYFTHSYSNGSLPTVTSQQQHSSAYWNNQFRNCGRVDSELTSFCDDPCALTPPLSATPPPLQHYTVGSGGSGMCSVAEDGGGKAGMTSEVEVTGESASAPPFFDELSMLRIIDNRQKERIHELNVECTQLMREVERLRVGSRGVSNSNNNNNNSNNSSNGVCRIPNGSAYPPSGSAADEHSLAVAAQNRFLNSELLRINDRCTEAENKVEQRNRTIQLLESELEDFKKEYVFLLQSCIRIPLHEHSSCDVVQVKLFGGNVHERRIRMLVDKARESDPTLPTFESVTTPGIFHVDDYGFRHSFDEVPLALHYIASQLNEHYESQSEEYITMKSKWRAVFNANPNYIEKNHENRNLCRMGIPRSMRSRVWRLLIHQQVADLKAEHGEYYYRNLCSSQGTPAEKHYCQNHQKQINLDLLRTMPSNVHFMSASCKGVTHLQAVLRAFCLHNPTTGYCQGMNFLAATALLFVSPEDAFWFLVAITERYFGQSYFDQSLTGAQADQEVLKEIVEQKFPRLANHLYDCDIDLTTITLNWFLALFFDAVPFQTMLRIWDCFLFEGPKVLFRFTIAMLGLYQDEILDHSDTISVMKVLKAAVRLTYDMDGLIKFAYDALKPFPSKVSLRQRHAQYLEVLQEKLYKRLQLRNMLNIVSQPSASDKICDLPIEMILFSDYMIGCGYVCAGNEKRGKLSMISFHENAANLNMLGIEFDCRPVSMVIFHVEMAFVSLLSGYIIAIQLHDVHSEILWELKLNDVALKLLHCDDRLYSCLANGTLAVLENAFERMPSSLDLYHIPISAAPITDAIMDEENIYLAVACKIVILNRVTLSTMTSIYVASAAAGSHVSMFEKIRAFSQSEYGIWLITAHSSLLQLWKGTECQMLFDITYDHSHRKPSLDDEDQFDQVEIYSIMYHENEIWVGTVDGYLMLYRIQQQQQQQSLGSNLALPIDKRLLLPTMSSGSLKIPLMSSSSKGADTSFSQQLQKAGSVAELTSNRYPPGKRLSPIQNSTVELPSYRQQMYYIPTDAETRVEETASVNEYPESERQTRKISVIIDKDSRKYSVNVKPLAARQDSASSSNGSVLVTVPGVQRPNFSLDSANGDVARHSSTAPCTPAVDGTVGPSNPMFSALERAIAVAAMENCHEVPRKMNSTDSTGSSELVFSAQDHRKGAYGRLSPAEELSAQEVSKSKRHHSAMASPPTQPSLATIAPMSNLRRRRSMGRSDPLTVRMTQPTVMPPIGTSMSSITSEASSSLFSGIGGGVGSTTIYNGGGKLPLSIDSSTFSSDEYSSPMTTISSPKTLPRHHPTATGIVSLPLSLEAPPSPVTHKLSMDALIATAAASAAARSRQQQGALLATPTTAVGTQPTLAFDTPTPVATSQPFLLPTSPPPPPPRSAPPVLSASDERLVSVEPVGSASGITSDYHVSRLPSEELAEFRRCASTEAQQYRVQVQHYCQLIQGAALLKKSGGEENNGAAPLDVATLRRNLLALRNAEGENLSATSVMFGSDSQMMPYGTSSTGTSSTPGASSIISDGEWMMAAAAAPRTHAESHQSRSASYLPTTITEVEELDTTANCSGGAVTPVAPAIPGVSLMATEALAQPSTLAAVAVAPTSANPTSRGNLKLRRKDLDFDEEITNDCTLDGNSGAPNGGTSGTVSADGNASYHRRRRSSRVILPPESTTPTISQSTTATLGMSLQMKLKISDKPVKCISLTRFNNEDVVVTGAGNYGDEEAILRWRRERNSGLWINDPLVDMSVRGKKRTVLGSIKRK